MKKSQAISLTAVGGILAYIFTRPAKKKEGLKGLSGIVANTIFAQLGGNRFVQMTGVKNLSASEDALTMHLPKNHSKAKYLRIEITHNDTYNMIFRREDKKNFLFPIVAEFRDVFNNQIAQIFTDTTGLYTSLGGNTMKRKSNEPKYEIGDMVYNWQSPNKKVRINRINRSDDPNFEATYRLTLIDKNGDHQNSKWTDESALRKKPLTNLGTGEGNFYIHANGGKIWYNERRATDIPNVYFAMGTDGTTKPGTAYIHRFNSLNPLSDKNGKAVIIPEFAGKDYYSFKR